MSATRLRAGATRAWGRIVVVVVAASLVLSGCATSHYQQVSCSGTSRQSIFLLEAQAVPSATQHTPWSRTFTAGTTSWQSRNR